MRVRRRHLGGRVAWTGGSGQRKEGSLVQDRWGGAGGVVRVCRLVGGRWGCVWRQLVF